jgi:hypothetical protein
MKFYKSRNKSSCMIIMTYVVTYLIRGLLNFILLMWGTGRAPNSIPIYSYIQQDSTSHSLFISGNCSACFGWYFHHQERIQLYLQHLVFVTPLLLSAAIVEELEQVWVCCGWRTPPTAQFISLKMDVLCFDLRLYLKVDADKKEGLLCKPVLLCL